MAINVLIVDDSLMMRTLIDKVLTLCGLEIGHILDATNGAEALAVMNQQTVDLVLADINMPVMNGEDLIREMSRKEELRSIPVVVISTDGTSRRMERMRELGVFGYLQKPFRPEELRVEIERVMNVPRFARDKIDSALTTAAAHVLETMCFANVLNTVNSPLDLQRTPLGAAVHFSGSFNGCLELWASPELASSLTMNFLGSTDEEDARRNGSSMLNELANVMCGATLTQLFSNGEFRLESPVRIVEASEPDPCGQSIESDDGCIWVSFDVGRSRWKSAPCLNANSD